MFPRNQIKSKLDDEIIRSLDKLKTLDAKSEEYAALVERMTKLHKLKTEERLQLPSLDTALVVGANIFGILWLTRYEKEHVINSKAFGMIMRPR